MRVRKPDRNRSGYVLLSVLLLITLVVAVVTTSSRGTILASESNTGGARQMKVHTVMDSGLAYVHQALLTDRPGTATLTAPDGSSISISVSNDGDQFRNIQIAADTGEMSRQLTGVAEIHLGDSGALPTLADAARTSVLSSPLLIDVTSDTTYEGQVITGIFLVRKGKKLHLKDCVLQGAIVSENALSDSGWSSSDEIEIKLEEAVLIEPGSTLAGCAIVAPDATLKNNGDARVQVHGVTVVKELELKDGYVEGSFHGQIAVSITKELSSGVSLLGVGRGPRTWPTSLKTGSQGISRLVFRRPSASVAETDAIRAFDFSAHRAAQQSQAQQGN